MLIRCFIWLEKREEKVDTDVPSCGTGFIGLRNGVYDVAERCVSGDEKGFFIVRKSLFRMEVRARWGGRKASVDVWFCVMC